MVVQLVWYWLQELCGQSSTDEISLDLPLNGEHRTTNPLDYSKCTIHLSYLKISRRLVVDGSVAAMA